MLEAEPGSMIYAGLKPGVDRDALAEAIRQGRARTACTSSSPSPGDCVFLPAGTVHAFGGGLAGGRNPAVQRCYLSAVRLEPPRPRRQTAARCTSSRPWRPSTLAGAPSGRSGPSRTGRPDVDRLVDCDKFVLDRWQFDTLLPAGGDKRCHILVVLEGAVRIEGDPVAGQVVRGQTVLLPAGVGQVGLRPEGETTLLDAYLP